MTSEYALIEIPDDASLEGEFGWAFLSGQELNRCDSQLVMGQGDMILTAEEMVALIEHQRRSTRLARAVIVVDDAPTTVVAHAVVWMPQMDNTTTASFAILVHSNHRRRGLGTRLLDWCEATAKQAGRSSWSATCDVAPGHDEEVKVLAPDGGWIYQSLPGWNFAQRRGWSLAQVERLSRLDFPLDQAVHDQLLASVKQSARGYRVETWIDSVPPEHREAVACVKREKAADAPTGDLDYGEETWDVTRVEEELSMAAAMGRHLLMSVAIHEATGQLVGLTQLAYRGGAAEHAGQWDTVVARAHRGHRLGMWIKLANLDALRRHRPQARRMYTVNAEENEHMLNINVGLGFVPAGGQALFARSAKTGQN